MCKLLLASWHHVQRKDATIGYSYFVSEKLTHIPNTLKDLFWRKQLNQSVRMTLAGLRYNSWRNNLSEFHIKLVAHTPVSSLVCLSVCVCEREVERIGNLRLSKNSLRTKLKEIEDCNVNNLLVSNLQNLFTLARFIITGTN